jgi:hypothetical protein
MATITATDHSDLTALVADRGITFVEVRTLPGVGRQVIDIHRDGVKVHQVSHSGTIRQAYARAVLDEMHHTDAGYDHAVAALRGE